MSGAHVLCTVRKNSKECNYNRCAAINDFLLFVAFFKNNMCMYRIFQKHSRKVAKIATELLSRDTMEFFQNLEDLSFVFFRSGLNLD